MNGKKLILIIVGVSLILFLAIGGLILYTINVGNENQQTIESTNNAQRESSIKTISTALTEYFKRVFDGSETFNQEAFSEVSFCKDGYTEIGTEGLDLDSILVPDYLVSVPIDISGSGFLLCQTEDTIEIVSPDDKNTNETIRLDEVQSGETTESGENNPSEVSEDSAQNDSLRESHIKQISMAVYQYSFEGSIDDLGTIQSCSGTKSSIGTSDIDLGVILVPTYLSEIPVDPVYGNSESTGYAICKNTDGTLTISVDQTFSGDIIQVTK